MLVRRKSVSQASSSTTHSAGNTCAAPVTPYVNVVLHENGQESASAVVLLENPVGKFGLNVEGLRKQVPEKRLILTRLFLWNLTFVSDQQCFGAARSTSDAVQV